jgi:MFS family permease
MSTPVHAGAHAHQETADGRRPFFILLGTVAILFAVVLAYAETRSFSWDEGFHVLAARLIQSGQRPYLDFCFPQTPLNAYWNAFWVSIFGASWRAIHAVAALLVAGSVFLTADFVLKRFPDKRWRLVGALAAACFVALDSSVVLFGPIGQAYAICLFLSVAAFRMTVVAVERDTLWFAAAAGLPASAAAASSLLTAPAVPVFLLWMLFYNRAGNRWTKLAAFVAGAVPPFFPVLWLFLKAPGVVWFNLVQYHLFFRRVRWEGATKHDIDVLLSWIDSSQAMLLGLLAIGGLLFTATASGWERARRAEIYLSAGVAIMMSFEIGTAHPTFTWYFLLIVPFVAIPATVGFYAAGSRLYRPDRPIWPAAVLIVLLSLGLGKALHDDTESLTWGDMEAIAKKVQEVTPPDGTLWSSEHIYFLTHRPVPDGMEFQAGTKLDLTMAQAAPLHILPRPELDRRVKSGAYNTISNCDDDRIDELGLPKLYAHKQEIGSCSVFWGFKK